ncbi:hypothetical protein ACWD25_39715 [Streptomyces sp. NPDC002920]
MSEPTFPETFVVQRDEDVSGISGEGVIAEGVRFSDGWVATHWLDKPPMNEPKTDVWHHKGIEPFRKIHGHGGRTRILWADEVAAARRKHLATIVEAFDVPPEIYGTEAEGAYWREQIERALLGASTEMRVEYLGDPPSVPEPVELRGWLSRFTDAVVPVLAEILEQRNRAKDAVGRAYLLADRWQAAHGSAMFLVRSAGAELRDVLDDSEAAPSEVVHSTPNAQPNASRRVDDSCDDWRHGAHLGFTCAEVEQTRPYWNVRWEQQAEPEDDHDWYHSDPLAGLVCRRCHLAHKFWSGEACIAAEPDNPSAAAECSAQYRGVSLSAKCIRAAGHITVTNHTNDRGHNWSDALAVYPVDEPEPQHSRAASSCSNPEHVCTICGDCMYEHPGEGGCPEGPEEQERLADELKREQKASAGLAEQIKKQRIVLDQMGAQRNELAQALREVLGGFHEVKPSYGGDVIVHEASYAIHPSNFNRWREALAKAPANCRKPGGCSDCPHEQGA